MGGRLLLNFDYDGVLVDSFDQLFRLVCETHHETGLGRRPEPADFTDARDLTFSGLANLSGLSPDQRQTFARHFHRKQRSDDSECTVFAGIPQLLDRLASSHDLTVVSAGSEPVIRGVLERQNLNRHFTGVHGAERNRSKAETLGELVREFGISPSDAFMIGDSMSDIIQGKRAGIRTVAVTWGYQSRRSLESVQPDHLVTNPGELLALFAQ